VLACDAGGQGSIPSRGALAEDGDDHGWTSLFSIVSLQCGGTLHQKILSDKTYHVSSSNLAVAILLQKIICTMVAETYGKPLTGEAA